jgi:hypothetical protein
MSIRYYASINAITHVFGLKHSLRVVSIRSWYTYTKISLFSYFPSLTSAPFCFQDNAEVDAQAQTRPVITYLAQHRILIAQPEVLIYA